MLDLLFRHLTDDTDAEYPDPETADGCTRYSGMPSSLPGIPYFVFKQHAQRFDDFLEIYVIRQASYIVMGLNDRRLAQTGFDHIRVNRTLYAENPQCRSSFASSSKTRINSSPIIFLFSFRFRHAFQLIVKTLLRVNADEIQIVRTVPGRRQPLPRRPRSCEADPDRTNTQVSWSADRFRHQDACYGRVYTAGQSAEGHDHFLLFYGFLRIGFLHERSPSSSRRHNPHTLVHEVIQHLRPFLRVHVPPDVTWTAVPAFFLRTFHTCNRADRRIGATERKPSGTAANIVGVAHPADRLSGRRPRYSTEDAVRLYLSVFPYSLTGAVANRAAQQVGHQLSAIADSQDRNPEFKYFRLTFGRRIVIYAVGTAGKDNARRLRLPDLFHRLRMRNHFANTLHSLTRLAIS